MWGKFAITKTQVTELQQLAFSESDPAGVQTQNLQNRNLTLYSVELRGHTPTKRSELIFYFLLRR